MGPFVSSLVAAALLLLVLVLPPTVALNITAAASVPSAYLVTKAVKYSADMPLTVRYG